MTRDEFLIGWDADPEVERALARVGRCEDLRLSPDGRLLVLAGFARHVLLLLDLAPTAPDAAPRLRITGASEVMIDGLELPHGVDFLDDRTLAVANRGGGVTVVALDRSATDGRWTAREVLVDGTFEGLRTPGSLVAVPVAPGTVDLLVCNNWGHTLTRHRLVGAPDGGPAVTEQAVLLRRWLDVPDGVAVSPDGRWLAVSDHHPQAVLLYRRDGVVDPDAEPVAVLRGSAFPHGLRFTPDGQHLLVADAGSPHLHVYARPGPGWVGVVHPAGSVRVYDDATFEQGRQNPQEGGPKGIDVTPDGRVVVVTSEHVPLVVLDGVAVVAAAGDGRPAPDLLAAERAALAHHAFQRAQREALTERAESAEHRAGLAHDRAAAADADRDHALAEQARAEAASAEGHRLAQAALAREAEALERAHQATVALDAVRRTRTFRLLAPLRAGYARLRR